MKKPCCLKLVIITLICSVVLVLILKTKLLDDECSTVIVSLTTGIVASIMVTQWYENQKVKELYKKKQAALLNASFKLNKYNSKWIELERESKKIDDCWEEYYFLSRDVTEYILNLYSNYPDVFDKDEILCIQKLEFYSSCMHKHVEDIHKNRKRKDYLTEPNDIFALYNALSKNTRNINEILCDLSLKWMEDGFIDKE